MVNMVAAIYWAVAGQLARWLRAAIRMAHCCAGALVSALKRAGVKWVSASTLPAMWQQFIDPTVELRGQSGQDVLEIGKGVMPAELGRLQQAHHHRGTLAGQLAAYEQPFLRPRPQGRIWFSIQLLSIGRRASSTNRVSATQRFKL